MKQVGKGFTLIEFVVGMVLLGVACAGCLSLLISQKDAYRDPLVQQMSVQIFNKIRSEIIIRSFDENSEQGGGFYRCGESVNNIIMDSCKTSVGLDGSEKALGDFNDVDDFITSDICNRVSELACRDGEYVPASFFFETFDYDSEVNTILEDYHVKIKVSACPIGGLSGTSAEIKCNGSDDHSAKKIDISILQRDGNVIDYSFIKANI
jgi:MSHA pilin protein MshD